MIHCLKDIYSCKKIKLGQTVSVYQYTNIIYSFNYKYLLIETCISSPDILDSFENNDYNMPYEYYSF